MKIHNNIRKETTTTFGDLEKGEWFEDSSGDVGVKIYNDSDTGDTCRNAVLVYVKNPSLERNTPFVYGYESDSVVFRRSIALVENYGESKK